MESLSVCLFVICRCVGTNLIGQAVQGAWQYVIRINLIVRAVQGAWQHDKVGKNDISLAAGT